MDMLSGGHEFLHTSRRAPDLELEPGESPHHPGQGNGDVAASGAQAVPFAVTLPVRRMSSICFIVG